MTSLNRRTTPGSRPFIPSNGFGEARISPRKADKIGLSELISGNIRQQTNMIAAAVKEVRRGGVIELDDDDDDDIIVESDSISINDRTLGWINSSDKGLSPKSPTKAARKARAFEYKIVPEEARSTSSSIIAFSGRPPHSPTKATGAGVSSPPLRIKKAPSVLSSSIAVLSGNGQSSQPSKPHNEWAQWRDSPGDRSPIPPRFSTLPLRAPRDIKVQRIIDPSGVHHNRDVEPRDQPHTSNDLLSDFKGPPSSPSKNGSDPRTAKIASASTASPTGSGKRQRSGEPIETDRPRPRPKKRSRAPLADDIDPVARWSREVPPVEPVVISPAGTPDPPEDRWAGGRYRRGKQAARDGENAPVQTDRPAPKKRKAQPVVVPAADPFPMATPTTSRVKEGRAEKERCDALLTREARALWDGQEMETQLESGTDHLEVLEMEPAKEPRLQLVGDKAAAYCQYLYICHSLYLG
jgi:hypothetical protein